MHANASAATRYFGHTDPGLVRENNEDALFVDPGGALFIVADGMGGRNAGEVASKMVVEGIPQALLRKFQENPAPDEATLSRMLHESVTEVSQAIYQASQANPAFAGLGATLVMVLLRGNAAWVVNMGDSPCFLYRGGELWRLAEEHNVAAMLLERGDLTAEEYASHPARSVLSRHMGMKNVVYADVRAIGLEAGDRLLLCSDGLTSMVPDDEISTMLAAGEAGEPLVHRLIKAALAAGGKDNVTVILIDPAVA